MKPRMKKKITVKKAGSYKGQPNKLGGGGRFKQMTDKGMSKGLVAWIGRKKHGAKQMAKWSAAGRKGK